jgi:hypothetical protein
MLLYLPDSTAQTHWSLLARSHDYSGIVVASQPGVKLFDGESSFDERADQGSRVLTTAGAIRRRGAIAGAPCAATPRLALGVALATLPPVNPAFVQDVDGSASRRDRSSSPVLMADPVTRNM